MSGAPIRCFGGTGIALLGEPMSRGFRACGDHRTAVAAPAVAAAVARFLG